MSIMGLFGSGNIDDRNREVILYILDKLKKFGVGRLKLMKLMFLLEHYDISSEKLTPDKLLGNDFIIYWRGPFSFQVYRSFLHLLENGEILEKGRLLTLETEPDQDRLKSKIGEEILKKLNKVLKEFGELDGLELEKRSMKLLGIKQEEKQHYVGIPVDVVISGS